MWGRHKERAPSVAPASPRSAMSPQALPDGEQEYEAHQVLKGHQDFVRSVEALNSVCVASSSDDRMIKLWNSTNGQLIGTLEGHTTWVACVCPLLPRTDADPDDPMAADPMLASGSFDTSIKIWNTRTGECVTTLEGHSDCARCLTVIPGQPRCIVSGGYDNAIKVWDYIDGTCIQNLAGGHTREVTCLCPLPSYDNVLSPRLISGSADASVKIWDIELGRCVQMLVGHKDYVRAVIALPPPKPTKWGWQEAVQGRVVSASGDNTLRVWCVKTGKCLQVLKGHAGPVQCVVALEDGARVVSGSFDTTLRIWDPQSGRCLQILTDHTHRVRTVAALPDGRFVSGADDMTVRVWRHVGQPVPVKQHKELKDRVQKKPVAAPAARQSRTPSPPNPAATMRTTGMLVNGLAITRRGIEAQIRQLQSLLGGMGATGGAGGANAEMAATTTAPAAAVAAELAVARKAEGASPARDAPSAGGDLGLASPDSRDGEEGEPRSQHHHRRHSRDGLHHRRASREEGAASPSPVPSQPEGSPAPSSGEASPVSSEMQSPATDMTGSTTAAERTPTSGGSSGSGHREHHQRSHHHHHRRRSHEKEEAAKKKEEEEAVWRKLEDEARQKEAEVAALAELEQKAKEERRRAREARKKAQEEARLKAEEEGRALREAEERAKAKAAEAAVAAAEEAEEAKRRWKEELEARRQEKQRKQEQEQREREAAAAAAAAAAEAAAAAALKAEEEEQDVTGDMPVPLGAADALEEGGAVSGFRYQAMLAMLLLGVVVVASAIAGAIFTATRLQHLQKPAAVAPISLAAVAPVAETGPACDRACATTYAAVPAPELETVEAHEAAVATEQLAAEQTALTWAEAAMAAAQAAIKAATHRDFTRTPLYHAGGDYYADLAEMVYHWEDSETAAAQQQAAEEPLTELLADQWAAWAEAAGREEWDVPRLSWALSSARVSTTKPIKPKKRRAPSVNTGALALKWEQAQQPAAATQLDPAEEAAEMVLERRIARMPRRRPLAVRIVLAPFKLAIGIIKLPFQVAFGVLKVVTWPVRAVLRA